MEKVRRTLKKYNMLKYMMQLIKKLGRSLKKVNGKKEIENMSMLKNKHL